MRKVCYVVCLLSVNFLSCAQTGRSPDAVYFNGHVLTVNSAFDTVQAFSVSGDRITAVGSDATILRMADKRTQRVDLHGATVIPGMTDAHDHLWNSAKFEFRGADMIGVTSLTEMQTRLKAAVAKARPGETVFTTMGWNIRPVPSRADLDAVSSEVPIFVVASRHATGVVNTAALRRLGLDKPNAMYAGQRLPFDKDGNPTGAPPGYPASLQMANALLPAMTSEMEDAIVEKAMRERNSLGITSIRELAVWPDGVAALERMRREHKLTVRMALGVEFPDPDETAKFLAKLPAIHREDPWLFLDSQAEEPWTPGTMPLGQYTMLVLAERGLGWRPAPHVNLDPTRGTSYDAATDDTLTAYEVVDKKNSLQGQRWYVEHVPFATPVEMDRMAKLGLIVSAQSQGYETAKAPMPADRVATENPMRDLLDRNIVVIAGSDYTSPTADTPFPNNPFIPFTFYTTRKTRSGTLLGPTEKITRQEALRVLTVNAAYATFQEGMKGQIAPGMLADFVILNQDPMSVPDDQLLETHPQATFLGGKRVYSAPGSPF